MKTSESVVATNVNLELLGQFFGQLYSFNESLKLHHWHDTGTGSYARHMANDQALPDLRGVLDRLVETSYAEYGDLNIVIPETSVPDCLLTHIEEMVRYVKEAYSYFPDPYQHAMLDDYVEAMVQLKYRIQRLQ